MLSKLFATIFVLLLLSVLRRLRDQRLEAEYAQEKQNIVMKVNKPSAKTVTKLNKKRNRKLRGKYSAVSISFTPNACDKVRSLAGQRFLAKDAPLMPIQHCPRRNICNCIYEYHVDRRSNDERSDFNLQFGIMPNYEEGENKSRRWYDHEMAKVS